MYSAHYSCQVLMKLKFSENTQISNFTNIRSVGAEFHAVGQRERDGQTDRQTLQS